MRGQASGGSMVRVWRNLDGNAAVLRLQQQPAKVADCQRSFYVWHPFLYVSSLRSPFPFSPLSFVLSLFFHFFLILSDNNLNFPICLKECRCSTFFFLLKLTCFFFSFFQINET